MLLNSFFLSKLKETDHSLLISKWREGWRGNLAVVNRGGDENFPIPWARAEAKPVCYRWHRPVITKASQNASQNLYFLVWWWWIVLFMWQRQTAHGTWTQWCMLALKWSLSCQCNNTEHIIGLLRFSLWVCMCWLQLYLTTGYPKCCEEWQEKWKCRRVRGGTEGGKEMERKAEDEDGAETVDLGYVLAVLAERRSVLFVFALFLLCSLSPVTDGWLHM